MRRTAGITTSTVGKAMAQEVSHATGQLPSASSVGPSARKVETPVIFGE